MNYKKILILILLLITLSSCWNNTDITRENNNKISNKELKIKKNIENKNTQISVKDFKKLIENPEVILLDVRTPSELPMFWKIRENQMLINYNDQSFPLKISELDKSKKYAIYCWHWNRSRWAREYMKEQWFSNIVDLAWGIDGWVKNGESVIK